MSNVISRTSWKWAGEVTLSLPTKRAGKGWTREGVGEVGVVSLL